jgi:hypothetical protein
MARHRAGDQPKISPLWSALARVLVDAERRLAEQQAQMGGEQRTRHEALDRAQEGQK